MSGIIPREDLDNPPTRVYSNGEIVVEWRPERCTKCEACWRGLPQVFSPDARPWVNIMGAASDEIRAQVAQCPDGALKVVELDR